MTHAGIDTTKKFIVWARKKGGDNPARGGLCQAGRGMKKGTRRVRARAHARSGRNDVLQDMLFCLHVTVTPAMPARLGSTELQLSCVPSGGIAQPLINDPDTSIEI